MRPGRRPKRTNVYQMALFILKQLYYVRTVRSITEAKEGGRVHYRNFSQRAVGQLAAMARLLTFPVKCAARKKRTS